MQFTAKELGEILGGTVEGDPEVKVSAPAKIEEAGAENFTFIANQKYESYAYSTKASVIIVNNDFHPQQHVTSTLVRVADPYIAFTGLLQRFGALLGAREGIEPDVFISPSAKIGEKTYVGAFSYIGENAVIGNGAQIYPQVYIGDGVEIGEGAIIYPGVKVYAECKIGNRCILHAGAVVGSDGFGFAPQKDGSYQKIPQLGNVVLEDDVEVGANTTIDRATLGSTVIKKGVKLDNLIQIAHNVEIGENTAIAAQAGISGSTKVGRNSIIGGQAGVVGHLSLAAGTRINAQSGVSKSITEEGKAVTGSPAFEYKEALKAQVVFRHLPELEKRIQHLEKTIETLTKQ